MLLLVFPDGIVGYQTFSSNIDDLGKIILGDLVAILGEHLGIMAVFSNDKSHLMNGTV